MSPLQNTNRQIREDLAAQRRRDARRQRVLRPIRLIDELLAELEDLHLEGRKRVPESMDERLASLTETLPEKPAVELRSRITIVHLMDQLYAVQDELLQVKSGRDRELDDDGEILLPEAS